MCTKVRNSKRGGEVGVLEATCVCCHFDVMCWQIFVIRYFLNIHEMYSITFVRFIEEVTSWGLEDIILVCVCVVCLCVYVCMCVCVSLSLCLGV